VRRAPGADRSAEQLAERLQIRLTARTIAGGVERARSSMSTILTGESSTTASRCDPKRAAYA
jgi:hypothetical protein